MKKEAADEEGEGEVDVLEMGAGRPGWLELLSLQGVKVLLLLLLVVVVVVVMVVTGVSDAVTSMSASLIKLWVGLGCGRKLLTLEMLHMPSRYCCAWMVTELRDPVSCPPATVTWTLVFDPEETAGLCDQPGTLCLSPRGSKEEPAGWPLDSCLDVWMLEEDMVYLDGCGRKDVVDRVAMSELKVSTGVWRVWRASCLSW